MHMEGGGNAQAASGPTEAAASSLVGPLGSSKVLLGTALVHVLDAGGALHTARILIDSASQISAIISDCAFRLGLPVIRWTASVSGLSGATVSNVQGLVDC